MRQEIRINFTGQTTLDNGITVGVLVGLNGENVAKSGSTTQVNRAYADFSGKFGLVRVGEANSALVTDCVGDPGNVTSNFGVNSPNESFSNVGLAVADIKAGPLQYTDDHRCRPRRLDRHLLRHRGQGQQGHVFLALLRGADLRRLLHADGRPAAGRRRPLLRYRRHGAGAGQCRQQRAVGRRRLHPRFRRLEPDGRRRRRVGLHPVHPGRRQYQQQGLLVSGGPSGRVSAIGPWAPPGAYYVDYQEAGYAANTASPSDDGWVATAGVSYSLAGVAVGVQGMYSQWGQLGASDEKVWGVSLNSSYAYGPGISLEAQFAYTAADYGGLA